MTPDSSNQPNPFIYTKSLSQYKPRIIEARTPDEVLMQAAGFLSGVDSWLDDSMEQAFHEEVAYLWTTFPPREKTLKCYRQMVQILLAQMVDFEWYAAYSRYRSEKDVVGDDTLVSFKRFDEDFEVKFEYVQYYGHILMRLPNSLRLRYRRLVNHPGRYTQGLTITRCKRSMAGLINHISEDVAKEVSAERPFKILLNSMLRTVSYQKELAKMGYVAPRRSAHMVGFAADLEKLWYEKHDRAAYAVIERTLDDLFQNGVINLIEEETHWHICLNPALIPTYEELAQK